MSESDTCVDVGYVDEVDSWKLESRFFPSKVGGRPAWLSLSDLPSPKEMECLKCHEPCIFLCQVYAPIETRDDCFHRTLFLFICKNPKCYSRNDSSMFIVYRSQLKRENKFYPFEPPEVSEKWHPECSAEKWTNLCAACGNSGSSHCGRCKKVTYCCRSHQIIHWKEYHKHNCHEAGNKTLTGNFSCLLPELELIVEPEINGRLDDSKIVVDSDGTINDDEDDDDDDDNAEKARIEDFNKLASEGKTGTLAGDESVDSDLLNMAACEEDKVFNAFKARISKNPGQVLRYNRGGMPLWLSSEFIPAEADISACGQCGSKRIFEFQILPQLLNHLSLDTVNESIDWGSLVVYTCERSCFDGPAYKKEFLWKQDIIA